MEMLTGEPNFCPALQPHRLPEFLCASENAGNDGQALRFDCYRLGHVRESIDEMEPVIRNCHLVSFDISAIAHAYAPNTVSPNGFTGEEACALMRYAGMSPNVNTIGIYGLPAGT